MDIHERGLREVLRVIEGAERGEPFGTEDMALPRLPYIGDVVRRALATPRGAVDPSQHALAAGTLESYRRTGDGCYLDNADADTLRAMVRLCVDQQRGAVAPDQLPRVFFRDIEAEPGWEVRVIDPGEEVAIEPGTWVEYVPATELGAVPDGP